MPSLQHQTTEIRKVPANVTWDETPWDDFTQEEYNAEVARCTNVSNGLTWIYVLLLCVCDVARRPWLCV